MVIFVSAIGMSTACDTLFPQVINLHFIHSNYKLNLQLFFIIQQIFGGNDKKKMGIVLQKGNVHRNYSIDVKKKPIN